MIRHGSPCTTVGLILFRPMTQRVPIPELNRAQRTLTLKTNAARSLTPHKVTLIRPELTLPDRQSLPARTIPEPIYP